MVVLVDRPHRKKYIFSHTGKLINRHKNTDLPFLAVCRWTLKSFLYLTSFAAEENYCIIIRRKNKFEVRQVWTGKYISKLLEAFSERPSYLPHIWWGIIYIIEPSPTWLFSPELFENLCRLLPMKLVGLKLCVCGSANFLMLILPAEPPW